LDAALAIAVAEKDEASDIISIQQADLAAMQRKFDAMLFHCKNLVKELQQKNEKLQLLKEGDRIQHTLVASSSLPDLP